MSEVLYIWLYFCFLFIYSLNKEWNNEYYSFITILSPCNASFFWAAFIFDSFLVGDRLIAVAVNSILKELHDHISSVPCCHSHEFRVSKDCSQCNVICSGFKLTGPNKSLWLCGNSCCPQNMDVCIQTCENAQEAITNCSLADCRVSYLGCTFSGKLHLKQIVKECE